MEIVLGVDSNSESCGAAEKLLQRLRFPHAVIEVTTVAAPTLFPDWGVEMMVSANVVAESEANNLRVARNVVEKTAERLRRELAVSSPRTVGATVLQEPSAADGLLDYADRLAADLIAVDGPHTGPFVSFLTGSVARALLIGARRSLLIAKPIEPPAGRPTDTKDIGAPADLGNKPLRVVIATDHSPYAAQCLAKLVRFAPAGIGHVTLLSAYPQENLRAMGSLLGGYTLDPALAVRNALEERNARTMSQLSRAFPGTTFESHVSGEPVNDAIANAMVQTRADLLIVGARGHGFVERLELGSVSFHQVMSGPYSVLVLRTD